MAAFPVFLVMHLRDLTAPKTHKQRAGNPEPHRAVGAVVRSVTDNAEGDALGSALTPDCPVQGLARGGLPKTDRRISTEGR